MAAKTADDLSKLALNGTKDKTENASIPGKTNGTNGNLSDEDSEDDDGPQEAGAPTAAKKKKKRKPKKKKNAPKQQSDPPRVKLSQLFPSGIYPVGEGEWVLTYPEQIV